MAKITFAANDSIQLPEEVLGFSITFSAGSVSVNPPFRDWNGLKAVPDSISTDYESGDGDWGGYQLTADGTFSGSLHIRRRVGGKPESDEGRKK